MNIKREDTRNIAIIAHVDHGKTTLVDELLKQSVSAASPFFPRIQQFFIRMSRSTSSIHRDMPISAAR